MLDKHSVAHSPACQCFRQCKLWYAITSAVLSAQLSQLSLKVHTNMCCSAAASPCSPEPLHRGFSMCRSFCSASHAGVAYWEYDYLNGATDSDNLVRMSDSTWTNILQPAAAAVVQKVAALPLVNGCVPG